MIIVSQDKKRTIESMELFIDMIIGDNEPAVYGIYADKSNSYLNLGIYKTEQRAKEIFQEIYTYKAMFEFYKSNPTNEELHEEMANNFDKDNILFDIYEMPEE